MPGARKTSQSHNWFDLKRFSLPPDRNTVRIDH
jgi:hypothetical protein